MMHRLAPISLFSVLIILSGMFGHGAWVAGDATTQVMAESCAMEAPSPCGCLPAAESKRTRGCCCAIEEPDEGDQPLPPAVRPADVRPIVFVARERPRIVLIASDAVRPHLIEPYTSIEHASNRRQHFRSSIGVWVT